MQVAGSLKGSDATVAVGDDGDDESGEGKADVGGVEGHGGGVRVWRRGR
jgi:hypothetical protein